MKESTELSQWLASEPLELKAALIADIQQHVANIEERSGIYGYSVLPPDYSTMPDPTTVGIVYNCESDLESEYKEDDYYRFCVDEWKNWETEGFDETNSRLAEQFKQFRSMHPEDPDSFEIDEFESAYIGKINKCILDALTVVREKQIFSQDTFLVVWLSDSEDQIVTQSAEKLNLSSIYDRYAAELT